MDDEVYDYRWMINEHTDLSLIKTSYSFARFQCLLLRLVYHLERHALKTLKKNAFMLYKNHLINTLKIFIKNWNILITVSIY